MQAVAVVALAAAPTSALAVKYQNLCAKGVSGKRFDDGSVEIRLAQFNIITALHHCQTTHVACPGVSEHSHPSMLRLLICCVLLQKLLYRHHHHHHHHQYIC